MYDEDFSDEKVNPDMAEIISDAPKDETPKIYCGPDKPKLGLKKYSVFMNGLTPAVLEAVLQWPEIEKLIVPYTELEIMRGKITRTGTPEHEYYAKIEKL